MKYCVLLFAALQASAVILQDQVNSPLCGECLAGFREFDSSLEAGDHQLLTAKVGAACDKYSFFMSKYPLATDLCNSAKTQDASTVAARVADYVSNSDTCGHLGFCEFGIAEPQDTMLLSLQARSGVSAKRHRVSAMAQVLAHKAPDTDKVIEDAENPDSEVLASTDKAQAQAHKDDISRFYNSRHASREHRAWLKDGSHSLKSNTNETAPTPPANTNFAHHESSDSHPAHTVLHSKTHHKADHWCITTLAGRMLNSCEELAKEVEVAASSILDVHNGESCHRANDGPHDPIMFRCSYADLMADQADRSKGVSTESTATPRGPPAVLSKAKSTEPLDSTCATTMGKEGVSSCWDLAEAVGLDGHMHKRIMNKDQGDVPCADSNPLPEDAMAFPCTSSNMKYAPATVFSSHGASSSGAVDTDAHTYQCIAQMAEEGVQSCWDLAEHLHMGGKHNDLIMNLENSKTCVDSNAKPHDRMEFPCSKVEYDQRATKGEVTDGVVAVAAPAKTSSDAKVEKKEEKKDEKDEKKDEKKEKKGFFSFMHHSKKAKKEKEVLVLPEGMCSTTMGERKVSSCWKLAVALGADGSYHTMITNTARNQPCGKSNPQPEDVMSYPCDFAAPGANEDRANTPAVLKSADKKESASDEKLESGDCRTSMDEQKVDSCWDLAVAIGMDGHDHTKIINKEQDAPCGKSNPQPMDEMIYPCDAVNKKSDSPVLASASGASAAKKEHTLAPGQCSASMSTAFVNTCWDLAVALGMDGNDHTKIINLESGKPCAESNPQPADEMAYPCDGAPSAPVNFAAQDQGYDYSRGGYETSSMQTYGYSGLNGGNECVTTMAEHGVSTCWDFAVSLGMDGNDHVDIMNMAHSVPCASSNPQPSDPMSYPCYQPMFLERASTERVVPTFPRLQAHGRESGSGWMMAQRHKNKLMKDAADDTPRLIK